MGQVRKGFLVEVAYELHFYIVHIEDEPAIHLGKRLQAEGGGVAKVLRGARAPCVLQWKSSPVAVPKAE